MTSSRDAQQTDTALFRQWQSRWFEIGGHYLKYYASDKKDKIGAAYNLYDVGFAGTMYHLDSSTPHAKRVLAS
jgi:hypothetical protein